MNSAVRTAPLVADSVTAAGDTSAPAANLILIAKVRTGLSARLGNAGGSPSSRSHPHPSCSFERSPTHNLGGCSPERNPISVQFGADLVARASSLVGHLFRRSSSLSPSVVSVGVSQPHSGTDGERSDGELNRNHESFDRKSGE